MTDTRHVDEQWAVIAHTLLSEKRDGFIVELFGELSREIAVLADDPRLSALLQASVTENVVSVVNFLDGHTKAENLDASSAALAHARTLAQRDVPLSALFRAYRLGHTKFVATGMQLLAEQDPKLQIELAEVLINRSAEFIDRVCEQVGLAYEAERDRRVADQGGIRQHWIGEILAGRPINLTEAESTLDYRFAGSHLAIQLWVADSAAEADPRPLLDEARRMLIGACTPVGHPLVIPRDDREVHVWMPVRPGFEIPTEGIAKTLSGTGKLVHAALGRPESGYEGFRLTMSQAKRVRDIALTSSHPPPASITYDQVGPVALMTDLDALRRFVQRTLGSLANNAEREETLRETLRAFLGHNRSYATTAQVMIMHRNSVQYRVNQALALCERDLADVDVALDLQVALNAVHWLGRAALDDTPKPKG